MAVRSLKDGQLYRGGITSLKNKTKSNKLTASGDVDPGAFIPLATTTLSTSASNITFSSIPQNYEHLQIRLFVRSTTANTSSNAYIQFNGDTSTNYSYHELTGQGSTAGSAAGTTVSGPRICNYPAASSTASMFGVGVIDILDYKDPNKYTTYRSLNGNDQNGSGYVILFSGSWRNTAPITSILIGDNSGGNFVQYTHAALYGIKRAGA
jgi:hypothetical protein